MHGIIRHLCINLNDKDMKVLLVLLSSIIFLGCATLGDSSSHVPVVYNDSDINFSNYFSDYRIVRFDSSIPDAYIRSMKRVLFLPERIVVFDENDNKILLFDEEGRFLKSSKSIVGRAKGEYISLSDVSLDIENEQIYALCDRPNKIMVFDKDSEIDYILASHSDIEKISFYPNEKEVLFFPFSSFEIKEIKEINKEKKKDMKLNYYI